MSSEQEPELTAPVEEPKSDDVTHADDVKENNERDVDDEESSEAPNGAAPHKEEAKNDAEDVTAAAPSGGHDGDSTPASLKKNQKRKSSSGVPEHKGKKANRRKSTPALRLDAKPGEHYWARLKGYPPWPAVICDEEMLPETLLASRPVTAQRPDGSYRPDYAEGGKNVKDRTFPVMYLWTNEFSWMPNYDLTPLDIDEVQNFDQTKKTKSLINAYEVAAEGHDLAWYKHVLMDHQKKIDEQEAEQAEKEAAKKSKKDKQTKRKSKTATEEDDDGDVSMADAGDEAETGGESAKKAKPSKKRKKEVDSDGEPTKPAKTPKTKLKVNLSKTPNGESASKSTGKSKSKTKAGKADTNAKSKAALPTPMTEAEKYAKRDKEVLYLRHKLQRGFLSRDTEPKEEEMKQMADHMKSLESFKDLEGEIIRHTKIHKVLKGIVKLQNIPKEKEYNFKQRSMDLLELWTSAMASSVGDDETHKDEDNTNGVTKNGKSKDKKVEEKEENAADSPSDEMAAKTETKENPEASANGDKDGEKSMVEEMAETRREINAEKEVTTEATS